jgi:hypothetical protein
MSALPLSSLHVPEDHPGLMRSRRPAGVVSPEIVLEPEFTGARALLYAMVIDMLHVAAVWPRSKQATADREWVRGAKAPIRFDWLCAVLGLDPDFLRGRMGLAEPRPRSSGHRASYWTPERRKRQAEAMRGNRFSHGNRRT